MVAFQNLMKDPRSKAILDQAQKSRGESSDGITVWRVTDHPDWLELEKRASLKHSPVEMEEGNKDENAVKEEDYRAALKKFEANHPTVKASIHDDGSNIIQVHCSSTAFYRTLTTDTHLLAQIRLPPPSNLHFILEPKIIPQNPTLYTITSPEKSKIHTAILNEITNRPKSTNFTYLLVRKSFPSFGHYPESANNELQEMIASYTTLKASPCVKCKRLMDPSAQFPTVRTRLRTKTPDSQHLYQWQAFHKSCVWTALSVGHCRGYLSYINAKNKNLNSKRICLCHLSFCIPWRIILYISRFFRVQKGMWGYVYERRWGLLIVLMPTSILDDGSGRFATGSLSPPTHWGDEEQE